MKTITFLFPAIAYAPTGGYKVVYEYANRLVNDGFKVNIIYSAYTKRHDVSWTINILRLCKSILRLFKCILFRYKVSWFALNPKVNEYVVPILSKTFIPTSDIYVATSILTAIELNKWGSNKSKNIYLIQSFENWGGITDKEVISSYRYGFKNIVISKWLERIVHKCGAQCVLIPNGFDFNYFQKTTEIKKRNRFCIAMLYHKQELKGCSDGFKALSIVKAKYPELTVNMFGVPPRPFNLPDWYNYYQQPEKEVFNQIYNEAAIFIGTSWYEGWGLTVGEAMICGCAIVCTDNDGYREMVEDGVTALLSPIKDPQSLANNIFKLIENDSLRCELSKRGNDHIKQFNWQTSYQKFKSVIE